MGYTVNFCFHNLYSLRQCIQIYGEQCFGQIYDYLRAARYGNGLADEREIVAHLRQIVPNVRDCFLVDQLVFLEKQGEAVASMHQPLHSQK